MTMPLRPPLSLYGSRDELKQGDKLTRIEDSGRRVKGKNHGNIYQRKKGVGAKNYCNPGSRGLFVHELKMFEQSVPIKI